MSTKVKYIGQNQVREITVDGKIYCWDAGNNKTVEIDDPRLAADLITQSDFVIESDNPEEAARLLDDAFPPPESQSPATFAGKIKSRLAAKE